MPVPGPQRTCVGCRTTGPRSALLRVVAPRAGTTDAPVLLVPDERRRLPGRGAWLHPDLHCLGLAERRQAFGRALRTVGPVDASALRALLEEAGRPDHTDPGNGPGRTSDGKRVEKPMAAR
nr:YlxR family protein [Cellulomonas marina]